MAGETPNHELFRRLIEDHGFSLVKLSGGKSPKDGEGKGWTRFCHEKRTFEEIGFLPGQNAGVACGKASGVVVLDIDHEDQFRSTCKENGWTIPDTFTVKTGSGKHHLYFKYPPDDGYYGCKKVVPGCDTRGSGGLVVAPGSVHPVTHRRYIIEKDVPPADLPEWFKVRLLAQPEARHLPQESFMLGTAEPVGGPAAVHLDSLRVTRRIRDLIQEGRPKGKRSEAIMAVLDALARAELEDEQVLWVFETQPIGEKYREKGSSREAWLMPQIEKAREFVFEGTVAEDRKPPEPDILQGMEEDPELTRRAFNILLENLKRYGNDPGKGQQAALLEVLKAYTDMVQGVQHGRFAFPLATGMGKTQSIVAWTSALYQLGITHVSLAVCASKVEALCMLKRDLMKEGVPEEAIGLLHSYNYDGGKHLGKGYASMPSTQDNQMKQILLVTHNRVRGNGQLEKFHLYKGKPRDLLIWDESLFISDTRAIQEVEIRSAMGWLQPRVLRDEGKLKVLAYLEKCTSIFDRELQAQSREGRQPQVLHLPFLTAPEVKEYKRTLGDAPTLAVLHQFLDISQADLRVVDTPQRGGFIKYDIVVPQELDNIIILDASHNIRELVQYDTTIQKTARFSDNVVSYEQVTVRQLRHASGRSAMTRSLHKKKQQDRQLSREIAEVVKRIPQEEAVILFTFKERNGVNFVGTLKADLDTFGIDTEAKVSVPVWQDGGWTTIMKDRFVWLTWGQETSLSQYSYCANVVFAGVLHRSHIDLASCIMGQQDNLLAPVSHDEISRVERSEIAHCLYQAMSRGRCRILEGSQAKAMNVWLIHKDRAIADVIREVMPKVNWRDWEPIHLMSQGKVDSLKRSILGHLGTLPPSVLKVSTTRLKKALDLGDIPGRTFTLAVQAVSEEDTEWRLEGRSFVRSTPSEFT